MIINDNNKNFILKGQMKRGFNQTPEELKEKLIAQNEIFKEKKMENKQELLKEKSILNGMPNLKKTLNELKKI